ncbi:TPA: hypothetical protein NHK58_001430 [Pseudomonas aeruginosa]|nr:hypothetical protein [Pseudomonas aeruginosa]
MKKLEDRAKELTETLKDTDISAFEEAADEAFSLEDEPEITNENVSEDFIQEQKEMMLDGSANDEPEFIDEELTEEEETEQVQEAVAVAEQIADLEAPILDDESELINSDNSLNVNLAAANDYSFIHKNDQKSIGQGYEDTFIAFADKEVRGSVVKANLLKRLYDKTENEFDKDVIQQRVRNELNYIGRKDKAEFDKWKAWSKERKYNPKAPSPDDEFLSFLKEAGLRKKFNYDVSLSGFGFKLVDNVNNRTVLEKKSGRCLINRNNVDEKTVSLALLSVGQKEGKPVWAYEPKPNSHEGTEKYYRTVIEAAIKLHADGKIKTTLEDIKIGNKHYEYILEEYKNKYTQNASLGAENKARNSNEQNNGVYDEKPIVEKSNLDKHIFDATYNLEKSVERALNRAKSTTKFSNNHIARGTLDAIADVVNGRPLKHKMFSKEDYSVISAFTSLYKEMNAYKEQMSKVEPLTPEIERALEIVNKLQETGFNPYSKNKKIGWMLNDSATLTMKKVIMSLEVLDSQIRKNNDLDYSSLRYDKTTNVFKKKLAAFTALDNALKNGDLDKISQRVDTVSGFTLNKVLDKNIKTAKGIFPVDKKITKFSLAGESVDLYFYEDKNGSVYKVKGNGNKYSKPELTHFTMKQIAELKEKVMAKPELDLSVKLEQPAVPAMPVERPSVEPMAQAKPAEAAPATENKVIAEPVKVAPVEQVKQDKIETYSIQSNKPNEKDFDLTFKNGVAVLNSVAYFLKKEVNEKTAIEDIQAEYPDVKQIKKLDFQPTEDFDLNNALVKWKADIEPVNDVFIVPTSRGYLVYSTNNLGNKEDLKADIKQAADDFGIKVSEINGAWTIPEVNFDIREIKEKSSKDTTYESSFKTGYQALQELKAENLPKQQMEQEVVVEVEEPESGEAGKPKARTKVKQKIKVKV